MRLLFSIALFLSINASYEAQVFSIHPNSTSYFSKREGAETFIDVALRGNITSTRKIKFTITGRSNGALPSADLDYFFPTSDTLTIQPGDTFTRFSFKGKFDNMIEGNDTFLFKISNIIGFTDTIGSPDSIFFIIQDSVVPPITGAQLVKIGKLRGVNNGNIPDSITKKCTVRGVLHGVNRRTKGYQMTICDETGCIGIFSNRFYNIYENAQEGDSVEVSGTVAQFRGLGQINFSSSVDTIRLRGVGKVRSVNIVTSLNESTESYPIRIDNLRIEAGEWRPDSSYTLYMKSNTGKSYEVFINNDSNFLSAISLIKDNKYYTISGLGGQFDTTGFFASGYQLIPRTRFDIIETGVYNSILDQVKSQNLSLYPNPATKEQVYLSFENKSNAHIASLLILDPQGKQIKTTSLDIKPGLNIITLDSFKELANGLYSVHLTINHSVYSQNLLLEK